MFLNYTEISLLGGRGRDPGPIRCWLSVELALPWQGWAIYMINQGVNLHLMGSNCWCAHSNSRINRYEVALYLACWRNILFFMNSIYFRVCKRKTSWTCVHMDSCLVNSGSVIRCRRERQNHLTVMLGCFYMDVCLSEWNVWVVFGCICDDLPPAHQMVWVLFTCSFLFDLSYPAL